jgi:hypothetical protein
MPFVFFGSLNKKKKKFLLHGGTVPKQVSTISFISPKIKKKKYLDFSFINQSL